MSSTICRVTATYKHMHIYLHGRCVCACVYIWPLERVSISYIISPSLLEQVRWERWDTEETHRATFEDFILAKGLWGQWASIGIRVRVRVLLAQPGLQLTDILELARTLATNSFSFSAACLCVRWKAASASEKSLTRRSFRSFLWRCTQTLKFRQWLSVPTCQIQNSQHGVRQQMYA